MFGLPIVPHYEPQPEAGAVERVIRQAEELRREVALLAPDPGFAPLQATHLDEGPSLHLDDLGEIPHLETGRDASFLQDRARLRAGTGDIVVTHAPPPDGYEEYCRERLGLGEVDWLIPAVGQPTRIALAAWQDRAVRRELLHALRGAGLRYVHPDMGCFAAWELAALLQKAGRRPVRVIAPLPGVTRWVNDKAAFAELVWNLFGERSVPHTRAAANRALLAERVREVAAGAETIGIKLPNSAGGDGNLVLAAGPLRQISLHALRDRLAQLLAGYPAGGDTRLLVTAWESPVLSSPSAQLWIPPRKAGPPVVEGLFEQTIIGEEGRFVGSRPARLPAAAEREFTERAWLLALVFQQVGYVGRCSFDALLVGRDMADARLEFIECNGRWGGTSLPMTLMNRLFGDWVVQPYAAREWSLPGLDRRTFAEVAAYLGPDLYDARTGKGRYVILNPTAIRAASRVDALALGKTWEEAGESLLELRDRLAAWLGRGV